ncbi:MAG: cobalamin B12-binding domain-containing protein [Candidatus Helarchaeota archaeon]
MSLQKITEALVNLAMDEIIPMVQTELKAGTDPQEILKALTTGMDKVGQLYEEKTYYLTELVLAGEIMKELLEILKPFLVSNKTELRKPIILATVEGDNHDIGKNILKILLISAGYEVIDLGKNVPASRIVEEVKKSKAPVVGLSSLLTMTTNEISVVDQALKEAGLRDSVRLIVGGAPLNMELAKQLGADDFAADAVEGVRHINELMGV